MLIKRTFGSSCCSGVAAHAGRSGGKSTSTFSTGNVGQRSYLLTRETNPELHNWDKTIRGIAQSEGLDPFSTVWWICQRDQLLSAAARMGFPSNFSHWKWGQDFKELNIGHRLGNQRIFEMVVNADPAVAYTMEGNELVDQKLVMCHVTGHSDFFKNNITFANTNKDMMDAIAEQASFVGKLQSSGISPIEIEQFFDMAFTVDDLIDTTNLYPNAIEFDDARLREPEPIPDNFGMADVSYMPPHIQRRFNRPEVVAKAREDEFQKRLADTAKTPVDPDADVLAFIIKHSTALRPWQRTLLSFIRERSYYFAPQGMTKVMNEGWAVYWHQHLMKHSAIIDPSEVTSFAAHNAGTLAMGSGSLNPYTLGISVFRDIKERWDKGQHGREFDQIEDRKERRKFDDGSMKGKEQIFQVRRLESDVSFIRKFLTSKVVADLNLFKFGYDERWNEYVVTSTELKDVRDGLVSQFSNGHRPRVLVVDGNYGNAGELHLTHDNPYELKADYLDRVCINLFRLWGRPIHFDSVMDIVVQEMKDVQEFDDDKGKFATVKKEVDVKLPLVPFRLTVKPMKCISHDHEEPGFQITKVRTYFHHNQWIQGTDKKDLISQYNISAGQIL